jgi:hypothetical protein
MTSTDDRGLRAIPGQNNNHWEAFMDPLSILHLKPLAYLDPGSGSYLLQLLIAAALGGLLALRAYWGRILGFFRRGKAAEDGEEDRDE